MPQERRRSPAPVHLQPQEVRVGAQAVQGPQRLPLRQVPPSGGRFSVLPGVPVGLVRLRSRRRLRVLLHGGGRLREGMQRAERAHQVEVHCQLR